MLDIHHFGLLSALFKIIDNNDEANIDYVIAKYFIENYKKLGLLNIYDVAEECYVSRSSIRRFCKQIGYNNFLELKSAFKDYDYKYSYFAKYHERNDYRQWYRNEIIATLNELDELIDNETLVKMAKTIHEGNRVFFITSYNSTHVINEFRRPLVLLHKIINMMSDDSLDEAVLSSLENNDVVFMVSMTGIFATNNLKILESCRAYKALITTSRNEEYKKVFDDVYNLAYGDYSNLKSVRGKYGIVYLFDVLYDVYLKMYKQN